MECKYNTSKGRGVWSQFSLNKQGSSSAIISTHLLQFTFSDCDGGELILYVCFLSWRDPAVRVECVNMCLVCLSNCFNLFDRLVTHLWPELPNNSPKKESMILNDFYWSFLTLKCIISVFVSININNYKKNEFFLKTLPVFHCSDKQMVYTGATLLHFSGKLTYIWLTYNCLCILKRDSRNYFNMY